MLPIPRNQTRLKMADQEATQIDPPKKRMVKRKPARKQVSPSVPLLSHSLPHSLTLVRPQVEHGQIEKREPQQTGQTYNMWYHKWVSHHSLPPARRTEPNRGLTCCPCAGRRRQVRQHGRARKGSDSRGHQEGRRLHPRRRRRQQVHLPLLCKRLLSVRVSHPPTFPFSRITAH